jgi:iron complex outermembrane recepter protein
MKNLKFIFTAFAVFSTLIASKAIAEDKSTKLKTITVTANSLGHSSEDLIQPVTVLSGDDLLHKLQPTIGETLSQEPGIRSTYFGPNASRPVIRGLEGDQIAILQNGINNLDASATSVDHNLGIDPLVVERIEVIRGPAALLYGSKAVGGVVNVIDNRIPNEPIAEKITGSVDTRYNSANKERSGSILLEGSLGSYAWHMDGFKRSTDNVKIPGFTRSKSLREKDPLPAGEESKGKIVNSQSESKGGTIGVSKFFKKGYFGASLTNYNNDYGTVAEEDVTIDMKQQRIDFAGEYRDPSKSIKKIEYKLGLSDYEHTEFEGSKVGTVFKNRGYDSRIELVHNKLGLFEGSVGLQSGSNDFSAQGEEAFLPPTTTNTNSGFIFEEIALGKKTRFQLGGRLDHQTIDVDETSNFGAAQSRDDLTGSGSLGLIYRPIKDYAVALSGSYTQRAPNAQELYSNGNHVATDTFEVGDKDLDVQKSQGFDLSLRKESGFLTGEINLFYNKFQNFITLSPTGQNDVGGSPIYNYVNLPAGFYGAEIKTRFSAYDANAHKLNFEIRGDYVEARNSRTGEPLSRISPPRVGGSAIYQYQKIGLRMDADYTFAQNHVSESESKTDGYMMLNASADYEINVGPTSSMLYLKATNLLNEEARNHVSFLKDKAPFAGRSIMVGHKSSF